MPSAVARLAVAVAILVAADAGRGKPRRRGCTAAPRGAVDGRGGDLLAAATAARCRCVSEFFRVSGHLPDPPPHAGPAAAADPQAGAPLQSCAVFAAEDIFVHKGVAQGEGLGRPVDVIEGDIFRLDPEAQPRRLVLRRTPAGPRVAPGSGAGMPGAAVEVLARHRLMGPEGEALDVLAVEVQGAGLFLLPLSPVAPRVDYTLIACEEAPEGVALADLLCVSFARGTMITMADGAQRPVETLAPGDMVLTRDHGRQPLRWLGRATLRAVGAFAPVVIGKGVLGNAADLVVSQHQRLFLYLRRRDPLLPTAEVLVQARHLVDGEAVWRREGGATDWFSLVFDRHEIIYAEGIPVESLLVNDATLPRLPGGLAEEVAARMPGLAQAQHFGTEADARALAALAGMLRARGQGR